MIPVSKQSLSALVIVLTGLACGDDPASGPDALADAVVGEWQASGSFGALSCPGVGQDTWKYGVRWAAPGLGNALTRSTRHSAAVPCRIGRDLRHRRRPRTGARACWQRSCSGSNWQNDGGTDQRRIRLEEHVAGNGGGNRGRHGVRDVPSISRGTALTN